MQSVETTLDIVKDARAKVADGRNRVAYNDWDRCAVGYLKMSIRGTSHEAPYGSMAPASGTFAETVMRDLCESLEISPISGDYILAISDFAARCIREAGGERSGILLAFDRAIKALEAEQDAMIKKLGRRSKVAGIVKDFLPIPTMEHEEITDVGTDTHKLVETS